MSSTDENKDYELDETVLEVLKNNQLKDVIPVIDKMVNRDKRQKKKLYNIIRTRLTQSLKGFIIDIECLNMDKISQKFCDLYIKNYGLFFKDFIDKYGEEIKRQYVIYKTEYEGGGEDENELLENMFSCDGGIELTVFDECAGGISRPIFKLVNIRDVFGNLLSNGRIDIIEEDFDLYRIFIEMGQDEGYYSSSYDERMIDAFHSFMYKFLNI